VGKARGPIAILGGWLCICLGVFSGLIRSGFLGLANADGTLRPQTVYVFPAAVVLWVFVGAALLAALPLGLAMLTPDTRRGTYATAAVMACVGLGLMPDDLGRAFGLPLLPGAALVAFGGWLTHVDSVSADIRAGQATGGPGVRVGDGGATGLESQVGDGGATRPESQVSELVQPAGRRTAPRLRSTSDRDCPWCSARIPAGASTCPACHATVDPDETTDSIHVPGLTEVSPELRAYAEQVRAGRKKRSSLSILLNSPSAPRAADLPELSEPDALRPPSAAVRAEMLRLDAEIAARAESAAGVVLPDAGPSAPPTAAMDSTAAVPQPPSPTSDGEAAPDAAPPPAPRRRRTPPA
jgi:hypothetical protein